MTAKFDDGRKIIVSEGDTVLSIGTLYPVPDAVALEAITHGFVDADSDLRVKMMIVLASDPTSTLYVLELGNNPVADNAVAAVRFIESIEGTNWSILLPQRWDG